MLRPLVVALAVVAAGSRGFSQGRDSARVRGTPIAKQFVGTWRLVSYTQRLADGTTRQNLNTGYIIYTDDGHMCAVQMNPKRPPWRSPAAPTPEEMMATLGVPNFFAYCAAVEVHAEEGFILHRIEVERSPNLIGTTRKRWFRFDGHDRVRLTVDPPENNPPVVDTTLLWERVQGALSRGK